ncbi:MAG TPA: response regulator [Pyrinomonadaceae bacterium]|jgi:CheY-like chemotaxis protein
MNFLPHARQPPAGADRARPRAAADGGEGAGRVFSILYAEQSPAVADAVRETLEAEGWRVEVCSRGDEAFGRLQAGARFDLLILDFALPGLDGVELARRARGLPRAASTPIIMFTAFEVEREARLAGVDAYLRKPRGVYYLRGAAARLLAR